VRKYGKVMGFRLTTDPYGRRTQRKTSIAAIVSGLDRPIQTDHHKFNGAVWIIKIRALISTCRQLAFDRSWATVTAARLYDLVCAPPSLRRLEGW
jgi:hypothetical protein